MSVFVFTASDGLREHVAKVLGGVAEPRFVRDVRELPSGCENTSPVVLVHLGSDPSAAFELLRELMTRDGLAVGVGSDMPDLHEFLELSTYGVKAYFNSYMADTHYAQLVRQLASGQTWFSPPLLAEALSAARRSVTAGDVDEALARLTRREGQIAADVAAGMSNKEIARSRRIAERTVKAHLTRIFKKLDVKSRYSLAVLAARAQVPARVGRAS